MHRQSKPTTALNILDDIPLASCAMHGSRSRVELSSLALARRDRSHSRAALARVPRFPSILLQLLLALVCLARVEAQQAARRQLPPLELRTDAIDVRSTEAGTFQAGAGANLPLGYYARLEIDGAGGVTRRDSLDHASGRVDVLARFLLDPFAEATWGFSLGGGISTIFANDATTKAYLVVVVDLEAPRVGPIVPALQLGLGGGVRIGVLARLYQHGRR